MVARWQGQVVLRLVKRSEINLKNVTRPQYISMHPDGDRGDTRCDVNGTINATRMKLFVRSNSFSFHEAKRS